MFYAVREKTRLEFEMNVTGTQPLLLQPNRLFPFTFNIVWHNDSALMGFCSSFALNALEFRMLGTNCVAFNAFKLHWHISFFVCTVRAPAS